jgi:hypothetical protein
MNHLIDTSSDLRDQIMVDCREMDIAIADAMIDLNDPEINEDRFELPCIADYR